MRNVCARRPAEDLGNHRNRRSLFQQFRRSSMPEIMEAQSGKGTPEPANISVALLIATVLCRAL